MKSHAAGPSRNSEVTTAYSGDRLWKVLIRSTGRGRARCVIRSVAMSAGLAPLRMRFEMASELADDVGDVGYFGLGARTRCDVASVQNP